MLLIHYKRLTQNTAESSQILTKEYNEYNELCFSFTGYKSVLQWIKRF